MLHDRNHRGDDSVNLLSLYVHVQQCLYEFAFECINNKYVNNKYKLYIICSQMPATEARLPRHLLYIIYLFIYITMFIRIHNRFE